MNREDIVRMAQEAGFFVSLDCKVSGFEAFAALVSSAEREACAKIAETPVFGEADDITMEAKDRVAKAIRARGTSMTKDEALKLALEALEYHTAQTRPIEQTNEAITAIKEALAQPEQEPVEWLTEERYAEMHTSKWSPKIQQLFNKDGTLESQTIQYTPQSIPAPYPLQRIWVGLTDDEIEELRLKTFDAVATNYEVYRAIEAKLKEKNT